MAEEKSQKRRGLVLHEKNPFMPQINVRSKRVTNKRGNMSLVDNDTGITVTSIAGFWEVEEVDGAKFVKLFVNGVKALKDLTSSGTKVFEVLYLRVQSNIQKEQIYMSFSTIDQNITPMSESTYARGMRELIDKGFLAATPHTALYWLNPDFMWNGDRLAFVKQYYKNDEKSSGLTNSQNHSQIS
jgi:hypothetical protein